MANNIAVSITADVADLIAKRAVMSAELAAAQKDLRNFAREAQATGQTSELKTSMLQAADAVSRVKAQIADLERQSRTYTEVQSASVGLSGQQRQAMIVVGEQFRQVGTEVALGIPPMQIFAQQAGQTIQALSQAAGAGSALGAFLGSGLGIAAVTAVAALAPLIASMIDLSDAQGKAVEKLQEDARQTRAADAAKQQFKNSIDGLIEAVHEEDMALQKQADSLKTVAQRSYDAAVEQDNLAQKARAATKEMLQQQLANLQASQGVQFGAAGGAGAGMAQSIYAERLEQVQRLSKEVDEAAKKADQQLKVRRSYLDVESGQAMADPVEQVKRKYEGNGGLIEQARQRALAEGKTSEQLQQQVKALAQQERSETQAAQKAMRPPRETKGPGATQNWSQELRQQQIAENNFFGDETARELKFWQGKLALTKQGSREWLEVQGHIYDASKTLARQAYQDHLADLNFQLEADRNNWAKTQADWGEKLAFIKSKFGEQTAEYRNAARDWTRIQTQHAEQELREAHQHGQDMVTALRERLSAEESAAEDLTRIQQAQQQVQGSGSAVSEIHAMQRQAEMERQLSQQKMADAEQVYQADSARLAAEIAQAASFYGQDSANYAALIREKEALDRRYAAQKTTLQNRMRLQEMQSISAVQAKYHSYIDGVVSTSVSAFTGLLTGQRTWAQAASSIYGSVMQVLEQQLAKMVATWIVQHLLMKKVEQQTTGNSAQNYIGQAGAAGVASMAAAPFPLNLAAPAFGAAMSAAAAGFANMGSFAKGANVLPNDMIAQIHAGERIVPAADNARLIALTEMGAGQAGSGTRSGDNHFHYNPTINGAMPFRDQLAAHESHLIAIFNRAKRRGAL